MVLNVDELALLTKMMTFQFVQQNPEINFLSAWIGFQDLVNEGFTFFQNNENTFKYHVIYERANVPNNAIASWQSDGAGRDCVAIGPLKDTKIEGWLN